MSRSFQRGKTNVHKDSFSNGTNVLEVVGPFAVELLKTLQITGEVQMSGARDHLHKFLLGFFFFETFSRPN